MTTRAKSTLARWILAAAVVAAGVALAFSGKVRRAPASSSSPLASKAPTPVVARSQPKPLPEIRSRASEPPAPARPAPTEAELQASGLKTFQQQRIGMPLRMAAFKAGLKLDDQQQDRLVDELLDFNERRAQTEKPIVKVVSFDGASLTLQIPAYSDQGETLKATFVKRMKDDFPPALAEAIERALDGPLKEVFGGFGRFTQTKVVTAGSENIHIRFYASVPGDVQTTDSATLEEILRLSGDESFGRDGLTLFHPELAEVVSAHFPAK